MISKKPLIATASRRNGQFGGSAECRGFAGDEMHDAAGREQQDQEDEAEASGVTR